MLPCASAVAAKKVDVKNVEARILNVVLKFANLEVSGMSSKPKLGHKVKTERVASTRKDKRLTLRGWLERLEMCGEMLLYDAPGTVMFRSGY